MKGKRKVSTKRYQKRFDEVYEPDMDQINSEIAELQAAEQEDRDEERDPGDDALTDVRSALPSIAIVGRPNVGKSSLFNAILKRRQAIVHFDSGVTRDRVSASGVFDKCRFTLFDTGGLGMYQGEKRGVGFWDRMIEEQVDAAIASADTILFVVDVQAGLSPLDKNIAAKIRTCGKKVLLVANKADNAGFEKHADEFYELGFDKVYTVSCLHRRGIDDMMTEAVAGLPRIREGRKVTRPLRIAVFGRPNVGKSSLVNRMLGEQRVIVSDVPGTTRDTIDVEFMLPCRDELVPAMIVDTAGLRKRSKVDDAVEQYSNMRAAEALETCDIVLFVIESSVGFATAQDKSIARMVEESGKGCIIVANKWDIRADGKRAQEMLEDIHTSLPKMRYAPVVFTSAKTGYNFDALYEAIAQLRGQMSLKISTSMLNRVIQDAVTRNLPPVVGTKPLKIYYGTMTSSTPPKAVLFVNKVSYCADTYKTYLVNYFRKAFGFVGFPVFIRLQERERRDLSEVVNHQGSTGRKHVANAKQYKEKKQKSIAAKHEKRAAARKKKGSYGAFED